MQAHPVTPIWVTLESRTTESLRGLSIASDSSIWASGAHGTVVRSLDGGSFERVSVAVAEGLDFRSLHAFDEDHAIALSAGSPARAFVTSDGGASWTETFTREGGGVFYDSLAFRDADEGIAIGDPIDGRFAILVTHDGGQSWQDAVGPEAQPGEAAFAASNGCIAFAGDSTVVATSTRVLRSEGQSWASSSVPIVSSASAGIFAIAFRDASIGYALGGDYEAPTSPGAFARTSDGGASWQSGAAPRGYRSSIAVSARVPGEPGRVGSATRTTPVEIAPSALIVVGTSRSDISYDEGASRSALDDAPLNTVRVSGSIAIAVGPEGRITRLALSAR